MKTSIHYLLFFFAFVVLGCQQSKEKTVVDSTPPKVEKVKPSVVKYGIVVDSFKVSQSEVEANWTLSHMLSPYVDQAIINEAASLAKDSAGLKYVTTGRPYSVFCTKDDSGKIAYCVYEKNVSEYVIFDFTDNLKVIKGEKPIKTRRKEISGVIEKNSNLSNTIQAQVEDISVSGELTEDIASIYAWSIDFFSFISWRSL